MKHIFGPVNSRRLGRSLGIDLLADKICNLNCIYCEVGPTTLLTCERREYVPTEIILAEIKKYCSNAQLLSGVDVITVTASGEPTLHTGLGEILCFLKNNTDKPLAVLTNGTTLMRPDVRAELQPADLVIPSLDCARLSGFRRVNRPAPGVILDEIIQGLIQFSHEFAGRIWLEILLVRNINDTDEDFHALARVIRQMKVERIQLNTVARPPLEDFALPVGENRLRRAAAIFAEIADGPVTQLLSERSTTGAGQELPPTTKNTPDSTKIVEDIYAMVKRRPCTAADINDSFSLGGPDKVEQLLEPLVIAGRLEKRPHGDRTYYH